MVKVNNKNVIRMFFKIKCVFYHINGVLTANSYQNMHSKVMAIKAFIHTKRLVYPVCNSLFQSKKVTLCKIGVINYKMAVWLVEDRIQKPFFKINK